MADPCDLLYESTVPQFYVGGTVQMELSRDIHSLEIEEGLGGFKHLCIVLDAIGHQRGALDEQLLYLDGKVIDFGKSLEVALGPGSAARTVFSGKVSGIELIMEQSQTPQVRVFAEDKLMELRMTRRFKTYEDFSDAEIVRQIASQHGLTAQVELDGPTYKTVQQWNQTDLAFLRDRAGRLGADVWIEGDTLHMASRDKRSASTNWLTLIQGNDLLAVEIRADLAHQRSSLHVSGFDEIDRDAIDEQAQANVVAAETPGGRHGIDVLTAAFGERASYRLRDVPFNDSEARAKAKAELLRRVRRFVTVRGITLGSPRMTVGSLVRLERVGPLFEGDGYYITKVLHVFDTQRGLRTHFDAERAWIVGAA